MIFFLSDLKLAFLFDLRVAFLFDLNVTFFICPPKVMRLLANMTQNVMDAVAYFRHAGDMMERLMATTEGVAIEQVSLPSRCIT